MSLFDHPNFLRTILFFDAATCIATGALMTFGSSFPAGLTQLPARLLFYAGLSLFPIAAFIVLVAAQARPMAVGVWVVIVGNIAWAIGSVLLLVDAGLSPNTFGVAFVTVQPRGSRVPAGAKQMGVGSGIGSKAQRRKPRRALTTN